MGIRFPREIISGLLALGVVAALVALAVVPTLGTATATNQSSAAPALQVAGTAPVGAAQYTGGSNGYTAENLPLVRTDGNYDTTIHVANATTGSESFTITFYNNDGSTKWATTVNNFATWASYNLDVGTSQVGTGFNGSAVVTGTGAITVSADVVNSGTTSKPITLDNLDSYTAIPVGATSGYFPLVVSNNSGFVGNVYVQNVGGQSTTVTLARFDQGVQKGTYTANLNANGSATFNFGSDSFVSVISVSTSPSTPIVAVSDLGGDTTNYGVYGITPMVQSTTGALFVPQFEYNSDTVSHWNTSLIVLNNNPAGGQAASYTIKFYDSSGNLAATGSLSSVNAMQIGSIGTMSIGSIPVSPASVVFKGTPYANAFVGSAVVTSDQGTPMAVMAVKVQGNDIFHGALTALAGYLPFTAAPAGSWGYLPALRKGVNGESTGFTVMNIASTQQSYTIKYWDANGNLAKQDSVILNPNAAAFYSQASDGGLPSGFNGSAQISNATCGGPQPVAVVDLTAGSLSPSSLSASGMMSSNQSVPPGLTAQAYLPLVQNNFSAGPTPIPTASPTPTC